MPKRQNKASNHPKKIQKFAHEDQFLGVEYYFENGLRKVKPYIYKFECHAKGRWFGSKLLDVFKKEFRLETAEYYETAIKEGLIKVNKGAASPDRILKNNDFMQSKVHRHEPPVSGEPIQILTETEDYLVINKPASIPVHPCGKYRHNTIVFILGKEYGFKGLHTIHRLDRLTSGLLLFARTLEVSHRLDAYVRDRKLEKTYLCKVKGEFPSEPVECSEPIFIVSHKIGVCRVKADGKPCHTRFERLSYDGETSIVKCYPHTGRMHQIRVHLQYLGYPIQNDPLYNNTVWGARTGRGGNQDLSDEQLLKDLIEQHDMEIDSALEKARLQILMNNKKIMGQSDKQAQDVDQNETKNTLLERNGCTNLTEIIRTSKTPDGSINSNRQSLPVPDLHNVTSDIHAAESLNSRTTTDNTSEILSERTARSAILADDVAHGQDEPSNQSERVAMGTKDNEQDHIALAAKSHITCACDSKACTTETELADMQTGFQQKDGRTVCCNTSDSPSHNASISESIPLNKNELDRTHSIQAVWEKDETAAMEETAAATADVAKDDASNNERLEDERTDRLAESLCKECREPMPDPEPHDMCIYLHALTYKGPDFEFSAPVPAWAEEHFRRTGTQYP